MLSMTVYLQTTSKQEHYIQEVQNSQKFDKTKTKMEERKIANISSIHSIEYNDTYVTMWQYYKCGTGKTIKLSGLNFESGLNVLHPFAGTNDSVGQPKGNKQRRDRMLCSVFFL